MKNLVARLSFGFKAMPGNVRGSLFGLVAAALFTLVAALVKFAVQNYHPAQVLFVRQLVMLIIVAPALLHHFPESLKTSRPALHIVRLLGATAALGLSFAALGHLPLATAISLSFTKTLFVTIFANIFLMELVGWRRALAVLTGFVGMLVILRPDPDSVVSIYALLAIIAAVGAAAAVTCVRALTSSESTQTLLSYQAIFVGLIAAGPAIFFWRTPDLGGFLVLVSIGVVSVVAQWMGVLAYRAAEVSVVTGMEYTKLLYASLIGIVIFAEWPDAKTLIGAAIIISASAFTIWRENVAAKSK